MSNASADEARPVHLPRPPVPCITQPSSVWCGLRVSGGAIIPPSHSTAARRSLGTMRFKMKSRCIHPLFSDQLLKVAHRGKLSLTTAAIAVCVWGCNHFLKPMLWMWPCWCTKWKSLPALAEETRCGVQIKSVQMTSDKDKWSHCCRAFLANLQMRRWTLIE